MSYKIYLAPLQGITDSVYRRVLINNFPNLDKSFSPFLQTDTSAKIGEKKLLHKLSEHATPVKLIPQLLSKDGERMALLTDVLNKLGFHEINLNLGCPYPTVTSKGRGSALLPYPAKIETILQNYYRKQSTPLSIKVRLGFNDRYELQELNQIFNNFPLKEIIIHPRTATQMYEGNPDLELFHKFQTESTHKCVYNGDIISLEDLKIKENLVNSNLSTIMIGRGIIKAPYIIDEIKNNSSFSRQARAEISLKFFNELSEEFRKTLSGDLHYLQRMKNIVRHMLEPYQPEKKVIKKIVKCNNARKFDILVSSFFTFAGV